MIEIKRATQCCICNKYMAKGTMCESIKQGKTTKYFHAYCYEALPKRGKPSASYKYNEVNNYG